MLVRGVGSCRLNHFKNAANRHLAGLRRYSPPANGDGATGAHTLDELIYPEPPSKHHSDLPSFLAYAQRVGLDKESNVYKGTHYEYTVRDRLARYGFDLTRVGGAGDGGIDLLGTWTIPSKPSSSKSQPVANPLRVLIQCKAIGLKPGPRHIRELEGAFVGAPVGWTGSSVLGFMVSTLEATKGTREALGRSNRPMGFLSCSEDGVLKQMLWNQRAEEEGLQGLDVVMKRFDNGREQELVLTRNGVPLPLG